VSRQARILLVDDRPENLIALEAILSSLNQILVPVRSGEQAVQAVLADEYAVALLDIMMPGMDGFETATQIKRHARSRDVPIIFLTAATMRPEQAIEETLALLRRLPAVLRDAEAAETTAQLAWRVGRLRDAVEGFGRGG
jgi:CheY-like chemotaxis protein